MDKQKVIETYKDFVGRQKVIGRYPHDIYCMAYAYLEALADNGIISFTETTDLRQYAEDIAYGK